MTDQEELDLIDSVENGEWKTVGNFNEMKIRLENAARAATMKDCRINVRISRRDVEALKVKALEEGIPYQTLVTSVLHKYVTGRIVL
jgi:predicted DNA binding CopG/RHH family protein